MSEWQSDLGEVDVANFYFVNLADAFDDIGDQEDIFIDSYHFGDKGNEIVAEKIYLNIKDIIPN